MVVFDSSLLLLLLDPEARPPLDPATQQPFERCQERIDQLLKKLEQDGEKAVIPTPVLSEILLIAGRAGRDYLHHLQHASIFRIVPYDTRAAIELADMTRQFLDKGDKRGGVEGDWSKVKFDRQIIAIACVESAHAIYSDDAKLGHAAKRVGLTVYCTADLPLPPAPDQPNLL